MVESVVKLFEKSPSPARVSLASTPLFGQSPTTTKPPVAVRVASSLAHFTGMPSRGSIGLPSMHLPLVVTPPPSTVDARDHCPAVGAGSCASVIGPAGPAAAALATAADSAAADAADWAAAAALLAAALSAVFEHPASAAAPSAKPTTKARISRLLRVLFHVRNTVTPSDEGARDRSAAADAWDQADLVRRGQVGAVGVLVDHPVDGDRHPPGHIVAGARPARLQFADQLAHRGCGQVELGHAAGEALQVPAHGDDMDHAVVTPPWRRARRESSAATAAGRPCASRWRR